MTATWTWRLALRPRLALLQVSALGAALFSLVFICNGCLQVHCNLEIERIFREVDETQEHAALDRRRLIALGCRLLRYSPEFRRFLAAVATDAR